VGTAKLHLFLRKYAGERPSGGLSRREEVALRLMPEGRVLLELGCGTGRLLRASAHRFELAIGFDLLRQRLQSANRVPNAPNIRLITGDMDDGLPFRDASVTCVICLGTFEYAYDPFFFLDEVRRVLVPQGVLLVQVANLVWLPRRLTLLAGRFPPTGAPDIAQNRSWNGGYLHSYTLPDLRWLLAECGFQIAKLVSSSQLGTLSGLWPSLLSSDFVMRCERV